MVQQATVLAVYRRRNTRHLVRLLADLPEGWTVGLWALDAVSRRLRDRTLGQGPGPKFELLSRLYALTAPQPSADVVLADDDVVFAKGGSLPAFLDLMGEAGLSLAQPAHVKGSPHSFGITEVVPGSRARLTTFVEIGPLFAVKAHARPDFLPFPEGIGMGWGLEFTWHDLITKGHRLGIIDQTPVRHRGPVATTYDQGPERRRVQELFAARGIDSWEPIQNTLGTWDTTQPRAPWLDAP